MKARLVITIDAELAIKTKQYAKGKNISVSKMVEGGLLKLITAKKISKKPTKC